MVDTLNLDNMEIGTTGSPDHNYFDLFLINLASLLHADTLYVAKVCPKTHRCSMLSFLSQGRIQQNISLDFESMPCFAAYQSGYAEYDADLYQRFPEQQLLQQWQSEAQIGIRLDDLSGQPIGILSVFFNRKLARHKVELNLLRVISGFIAREMMHEINAELQSVTTDFLSQFDNYTRWLEDIIDQGRLTSWSYYPDTDHLECSESIAKVIDADDVSAMTLDSLLALVIDADKITVLDDFRAAMNSETNDSIRVIYHITTLQNATKCIQTDIYPILNDAGNVVRLDCISKDITAIELSKGRAKAQEKILETILSASPVGVIKLDAERGVNWLNKQACKMFGYSLEEFHQHKSSDGVISCGKLDLYFQDDVAVFDDFYQEIYDGKRDSFTLSSRYRRKDGCVLWAKVVVTAVKNEHQQIAYFINTIQDLTENEDNKQRLALIESVYKCSTEGIMLCDANEKIIDVNPAFEAITGYSRDEAVGRTHNIIRSGVHDDQFYEEIKTALITVGEWKGTIWSRNSQGDIIAQQVKLLGIKDNGKLKYFFGVFSDVTESKKTEQQIITQANFDTLTGLPNRQYFSSEVRRMIDKAKAEEQKFAILYIDLDDFQSVNNSEDYMAGDRLLKEITGRLQYRCRDHDFIARIDGDEFAFIVPELVNKRQAEVYAKQLQGVFAQAFQLSNQQRYLTASVGVTMFPEDGIYAEVLMQNAEQAIFEAKRSGRNQCVAFTQELSDAAILKHQTMLELADAIKKGHLDVYYQPIVDNVSGKVDKMEALVRWNNKDRGFISPAEFIPLAEEGGLIQGLGEFVLDQACCDLKILHDMGFDYMEVSVNRSILEFKTVDMQASEWLKVISSHQLPYESVTMEITESLLMDIDGQYMRRINALKQVGVKIAIDDFGTGYSSLNYLRSLPADLVKIDRSFINSIPENEQDNLLLHGIITIVHNLGMKVVTEGVETDAQLKYLMDKKCDYSQGYLLCRPVPLEKLIEYLSENKVVI